MNRQEKLQPQISLLIFAGVFLMIILLYFIGRLILPDSAESLPTPVPTLVLNTETTPTLAAYNYESLPTPEAIASPVVLETATAVTNTFLIPYQPLPPLPAEDRGLISNGDRSQRVVALTFDLCETADNPSGFDLEIVNVLNNTETPATFFLGGLWMFHNEAETRALAKNPLFELGNHAWSHLDFAQITPEQMSTEIILTQQKMWDLFGWQTSLFRLPYGTYTEQSLDIIADHGMLTIQWDVVSGDPDPNVLAGPMTDWVFQQVQPGSIIIMHANGRGWHTAEALPEIISTLRADGYRFVTISELLGLEPQTPLHKTN